MDSRAVRRELRGYVSQNRTAPKPIAFAALKSKFEQQLTPPPATPGPRGLSRTPSPITPSGERKLFPSLTSSAPTGGSSSARASPSEAAIGPSNPIQDARPSLASPGPRRPSRPPFPVTASKEPSAYSPSDPTGGSRSPLVSPSEAAIRTPSLIQDEPAGGFDRDGTGGGLPHASEEPRAESDSMISDRVPFVEVQGLLAAGVHGASFSGADPVPVDPEIHAGLLDEERIRPQIIILAEPSQADAGDPHSERRSPTESQLSPSENVSGSLSATDDEVAQETGAGNVLAQAAPRPESEHEGQDGEEQGARRHSAVVGIGGVPDGAEASPLGRQPESGLRPQPSPVSPASAGSSPGARSEGPAHHDGDEDTTLLPSAGCSPPSPDPHPSPHSLNDAKPSPTDAPPQSLSPLQVPFGDAPSGIGNSPLAGTPSASEYEKSSPRAGAAVQEEPSSSQSFTRGVPSPSITASPPDSGLREGNVAPKLPTDNGFAADDVGELFANYSAENANFPPDTVTPLSPPSVSPLSAQEPSCRVVSESTGVQTTRLSVEPSSDWLLSVPSSPSNKQASPLKANMIPMVASPGAVFPGVNASESSPWHDYAHSRSSSGRDSATESRGESPHSAVLLHSGSPPTPAKQFDAIPDRGREDERFDGDTSGRETPPAGPGSFEEESGSTYNSGGDRDDSRLYEDALAGSNVSDSIVHDHRNPRMLPALLIVVTDVERSGMSCDNDAGRPRSVSSTSEKESDQPAITQDVPPEPAAAEERSSVPRQHRELADNGHETAPDIGAPKDGGVEPSIRVPRPLSNSPLQPAPESAVSAQPNIATPHDDASRKPPLDQSLAAGEAEKAGRDSAEATPYEAGFAQGFPKTGTHEIVRSADADGLRDSSNVFPPSATPRPFASNTSAQSRETPFNQQADIGETATTAGHDADATSPAQSEPPPPPPVTATADRPAPEKQSDARKSSETSGAGRELHDEGGEGEADPDEMAAILAQIEMMNQVLLNDAKVVNASTLHRYHPPPQRSPSPPAKYPSPLPAVAPPQAPSPSSPSPASRTSAISKTSPSPAAQENAPDASERGPATSAHSPTASSAGGEQQDAGRLERAQAKAESQPLAEQTQQAQQQQSAFATAVGYFWPGARRASINMFKSAAATAAAEPAPAPPGASRRYTRTARIASMPALVENSTPSATVEDEAPVPTEPVTVPAAAAANAGGKVDPQSKPADDGDWQGRAMKAEERLRIVEEELGLVRRKLAESESCTDAYKDRCARILRILKEGGALQ